MKRVLFIIITCFLLLSGSVLAQETYIFIDTLDKISIPDAIYKVEKDTDFFYKWEAPSSQMNVIPFDLNNDGTSELFVSNPHNTSLFSKFWRLYMPTNYGYKLIAEMPCSSIRVCNDMSDGYKVIECYNYVTVVEGLITKFKFFSDQYYVNCINRIDSKEFYLDQYPDQKK